VPIGDDALAGYHFGVEIDGVTMAQFKEVGGISAEIQPIEMRENKLGGLPVIHQLPGSIKWAPLTLKHGKTQGQDLWQWHQQVQEGKIDEARRNGSVVLYDYQHGEVGRYNFVAGWPSKVSIGTLTAGGNDILVEECTIVHEGIAPA
jgi:phage tail-like protein